MAMYDDPRDTRRRKNIVPRSRSFFPAADRLAYGTPAYNEREFQRIAGRDEMARATGRLRASGFTDSEIRNAMGGVRSAERARYGGLYPPGPGTYYNARRYAGAPLSTAIAARANLTRAWQDDLEFNRVANPGMAAAMDAERIGGQYGGGGSWAGRPGYQTVQLPGGGSAVVSNAVAQKAYQRYGTNNSRYEALRQTAAGGTPAFLNNPQTPYERSWAMGFNSPGAVERPTTNLGYQVGQALGHFGTLGYNAIASLFRPRQQPNQSVVYDNSEPRRYFDF